MRTLFVGGCLATFLLFELLLSSSIAFSQMPPIGSSLTLFIGWSDETYVKYGIQIRFLPQNEYRCLNVLLPFPTEKMLFCRDDVICAWQTVTNKFTSMYFILPPNCTDVVVEFLSAPIVVSSPTGETRRLSIDFTFGDAPPEIRWLMTQNITVIRFDEIRIIFPFMVSMESIDDTPSEPLIEGQSRIYSYDNIIEKGGSLTIRYPNPQSSWLIWGESIIAACVGLAAAFFMYISTDEEKIRRKRKLAWGVVIILWAGTVLLTLLWMMLGSWPVNRILPIWISCIANAIVVVAWIPILLRRETQTSH